MDSHTHRHRHFVALPAFLLVIGMSIADAQGGVANMLSSFSPTTDQYDVSVDGARIVGSEGVHTELIGSLTATTFDGGAYYAEHGDVLTVAALTSPVFITHGDQRMIVPVGMQWTASMDLQPLTAGFDSWMLSRAVFPLPEHFIEKHTKQLLKAQGDIESTLPERRDALPRESITDPLLLPAQLEVQQQERAEHILGVIRSVVEGGDVHQLTDIVEDEEVATALLSDRGREVLAILLSTVELDTAMRMELLVHIADNEALWVLTSFHPAYRDVAWSLVDPEVSVESQLTRAFLFPFSTFSPEPVSDFVFDRYYMTLTGMVTQVGDTASFIDHLLDAHLTLVDRLEAKGYPARAAHVSDILVDLIQSQDTTTEAMDKALRYLSLSSAVDLSPIPEKKEEVEEEIIEEPSVPEIVLHPEEVEAKATMMLQEAGALFTVDTGIAAFADNKARVSDVYFNAGTEDRRAVFTLDVVTEIVSEIEINGQSDFPYEPSFAGFVEWISK